MSKGTLRKRGNLVLLTLPSSQQVPSEGYVNERVRAYERKDDLHK
jgi:hypothetical protein